MNIQYALSGRGWAGEGSVHWLRCSRPATAPDMLLNAKRARRRAPAIAISPTRDDERVVSSHRRGGNGASTDGCPVPSWQLADNRRLARRRA